MIYLIIPVNKHLKLHEGRQLQEHYVFCYTAKAATPKGFWLKDYICQLQKEGAHVEARAIQSPA